MRWYAYGVITQKLGMKQRKNRPGRLLSMEEHRAFFPGEILGQWQATYFAHGDYRRMRHSPPAPENK